MPKKDPFDLETILDGAASLQTEERRRKFIVTLKTINQVEEARHLLAEQGKDTADPWLAGLAGAGLMPSSFLFERTTPEGQIEIYEIEFRVQTATGRIVELVSDKVHYAGTCDNGHLASSDELFMCSAPGCTTTFCPKCGGRYQTQPRLCKKHLLFFQVRQVLKFIFSPFVSISSGVDNDGSK